MTQREQVRLQVLNSLLAGHMTMDQAATLMGVGTRHTRRILAAYREEGAAALSHGNRGLRATNATPETTKAEVLRLARSRYSETNHTHLSELLRERKGIDIARTTLRRILAGAGVKSPRRRRPPQHRVRRQRMPREGMLIQVDGSHHRWLGHHVSPFALLLAVDDATGIVVNALFCEQENTRDYLLLMRGLLQRYGIPVALYTDRHSVFKNVPGSGHAGAPTQFSRAMDELGIRLVFALSPQAKGRVERTAGTFQNCDDQRQLLLPVDADYSCRSWGETIWYRRYRIGHRSAGSATEAEANGRQEPTSGGGGIWYERADGADVAARQAAVGEEGQAEVANPTGPVRRGVGRGGRAPSAERR